MMLALFTFSANAQYSIGASVGLPTGDAGDLTTLALGFDTNYIFESDHDVAFGISAGYLTFLGDQMTVANITISVDDVSFIPLAGLVRYQISDNFNIGTCLGYAIGINKGIHGGIYYKPTIGYSIGEKISLNLFYSGISADDVTVSSFGMGIALVL
ncbi:MAG: hypothetical protein JXQ93_02215 [Flavobacteriaceae bacterium]